MRQFPIIPCNLFGSQPNLQRQVVGQMLEDLDKRFPGRLETMFSALCNVVPSHLADPAMYNFRDLKITGEANPEGDIGFDRESFKDPLPPESAIPIHNILASKRDGGCA